jgi:hypothetical protein
MRGFVSLLVGPEGPQDYAQTSDSKTWNVVMRRIVLCRLVLRVLCCVFLCGQLTKRKCRRTQGSLLLPLPPWLLVALQS